jgi:mono/diheme cytochrome c family protein
VRYPIALTALALLLVLAALAASPVFGGTDSALLPGRSAPPAQSDDTAVLYQLHCASCHGGDGTGNGLARVNLHPPPADLTRGLYKTRSTPAGALPTDEDILRVIRAGVPGTAMPGFAGILTQEQQLALVDYVKAFSPRFRTQQPQAPFAVPERPLSGPGGIANGKDSFARLGCNSCHGDDARGYAPGPDGLLTFSVDLTAPWSFKNGSDPEDIYRALTTGIDGTAMEPFVRRATDGERWELVFYIKSIARVPVWNQSDPARLRDVPTGGIVDPIGRGEYLVRALGCGRCHTPTNADGSYDPARALSGGTRIEAWPYGVFYSTNLTSDATGLWNKTEDQIVRAVTAGQTGPLGLYRLNPVAMPWPDYAALSPDDARAIAAYLKSLPPIYNAVPPADGYGFFGTFAGKLEMLVLGLPPTVEIQPGNFGSPTQSVAPPAASQRHQLAPFLAIAAVLLIAGSFDLVLLLLPRLRFRPDQLLAANRAGMIVGLFGIFAGFYIYLHPLDAYLPIRATAPLPPAVGITDPGDQALAERGRTIATISGCANCHSTPATRLGAGAPAPLSGGPQLRSALFGTAYGRNLTPDDSGLAGWSELELKRALRSGRSRDGRAIHWQAMPWDHYSNWNEEDLQALVFYLGHLAPQQHPLPLIAPPAPDDPAWLRIVLRDFAR